jgi:hypothetical protein
MPGVRVGTRPARIRLREEDIAFDEAVELILEGANNDFENLRDDDYLFHATAKPHGAESCIYFKSTKTYQCRFNYKTSNINKEYEKMISNITKVIPANFVWKPSEYTQGGEFIENGDDRLRRIELRVAPSAESGRSNIFVRFRQPR